MTATFLAARWLGLHTSTAGSTGPVLGEGAEISHAVQCRHPHPTPRPPPKTVFDLLLKGICWVMAQGTSLSIFMPFVSDRAEHPNAEETRQMNPAGPHPPQTLSAAGSTAGSAAIPGTSGPAGNRWRAQNGSCERAE